MTARVGYRGPGDGKAGDGRPMRVALLTWNYPPVPTGIGRAAEAIADGLAGAGCDVTVFSADRAAGCERVGAVRVVGCAVPDRLGVLRRRAAVGHLAAPLAFRAAVLAAHRRAPFDVVESTNWYAPAALLPKLAPLVVRCSTPAVKTAPERAGPRDALDLSFAHALERRLVHRADMVVFNTAASAALLAPLYRLPARTPRAVVGLALADDLVAEGAAAPWPDAPTLAFVGRAERRKGFDELIGALARVRQRVPARLALVGTEPGDVSGALARLGLPPSLGGAIDNHGRTDDATMRRVLAGARLVVAPSRTESYGIVYREAAAFGRPLVAAAEDASAAEFIAATGAGVLTAAVDAEAIAAAILRLLDDPAAASRCRAAGLAHARTLTRAALAEATLAAYAHARSADR